MLTNRTIKTILIALLLLIMTIGGGCTSEPIPSETTTVATIPTIQQTQEEPSKQITQLFLTGDMNEMQKKDDIRSISATFTQNGTQVDCYATIKVQGTSSLAYEKKNYTISFFTDSEHKNKNPIDFGWGAQSKYCLKANWIDKTHARNVVTAKLVTEVQSKYGVLEQAPRNGAVRSEEHTSELQSHC